MIKLFVPPNPRKDGKFACTYDKRIGKLLTKEQVEQEVRTAEVGTKEIVFKPR